MGQQFVVKVAIRDENAVVFAEQMDWVAVKIGGLAARFYGEQQTGGVVPRAQRHVDIGVAVASGHRAQPQHCRAMAAELADIDAQIAALQQKRKEQLNRIENKQAEQEEAIDAESRAQTEMEALNQETETIREQLEEARDEAHNQHAGRRAIELDIIRAQEEMESRRLSLAAIERTLNPNNDAPPVFEESDSLL